MHALRLAIKSVSTCVRMCVRLALNIVHLDNHGILQCFPIDQEPRIIHVPPSCGGIWTIIVQMTRHVTFVDHSSLQ